MTDRSPLDYDVSVSAAKRRRARRRGMSGAVEGVDRACDWPGCEEAAQYRAPVSPERLSEFRWFCLEHVRAYNAGWDFFANRSEDEVERMLNGNAWERPTWTLGDAPRGPQGLRGDAEGRAWARFGFDDPFELLGEAATISPAPGREARGPRFSRQEQQALDTLGVPHQDAERGLVRKRYRDLVKALHPDMNGGENPDPERLARVLRAWDILRASPRLGG